MSVKLRASGPVPKVWIFAYKLGGGRVILWVRCGGEGVLQCGLILQNDTSKGGRCSGLQGDQGCRVISVEGLEYVPCPVFDVTAEFAQQCWCQDNISFYPDVDARNR